MRHAGSSWPFCRFEGQCHTLIDWLSKGFTPHSTQNRSFRRRFHQPISWHSTEETKSNTTKAHIPKWTITQNNPKKLNLAQINCNTQYNHRKAKSNQQTTVRSVHMCAFDLHNVAHNTAQNKPDNFPSYPPDNRDCFDDVYLSEGGKVIGQSSWSLDEKCSFFG